MVNLKKLEEKLKRDEQKKIQIEEQIKKLQQSLNQLKEDIITDKTKILSAVQPNNSNQVNDFMEFVQFVKQYNSLSEDNKKEVLGLFADSNSSNKENNK